MNYRQTLDYLYARLPMYQRIGKDAYKPGLERIEDLLKELHHPEKKIKTIHVAGTNGKGSVSHMLSSIFQEAGYKTGLYTSPHLVDFRERIRVNGKMLSKQWVTQFVQKNKTCIEHGNPSFFEVTVAMAMEYFHKQKVDIAIIEVGLGGRLDSTNVIMPELSIITNISFDHMDLLGNTLAEIAAEKAGIIKQNIPVVIGETLPETKPVFIEKAKKSSSSIYFAETYNTSKNNIVSDLKGIYQHKNIRTVLQIIDVLKKMGYPLKNTTVLKGMKRVIQNTGFQGRWQIIQKKPLVICDTGHNEAGIQEVLKNIQKTPHQQLHLVFGMVNDKDSSKIFALLPTSAQYYFCKPSIPRGKEVDLLQKEAALYGLQGNTHFSVMHAYKNALHNAAKEDLIFIGGSTFVVADFLANYKR